MLINKIVVFHTYIYSFNYDFIMTKNNIKCFVSLLHFIKQDSELRCTGHNFPQ